MSRECPGGCCPHDGATLDAGCPEDLPGASLLERAAHLYACRVLSTYKIAAVTGTGRQRITRVLRKAGIAVKPYGAGRRPPRVAEDERLDQLMAHLYQDQRMPSPQIARVTGIPERTVRDRLRARGVPIRTRGLHNREDRTVIPPGDLAALYVRGGLSADETGRLLGVSRKIVLRSAHDQGLPVRVGGPPPARGPSEIELLAALYADPQVRRALNQHGVPVVTLAGPIWERFPVRHQLTVGLATDLYEGCGLSLHHIELLTGQPTAAVSALFHASGVQLRPAGGRSPFMRRWRETHT
ncbi:MAG TPA: hypothetical protein VF223_29165 [Trebonia sp.]